MKAIMKAVVVALLAVFAFPSVSQAAQAVREDSRPLPALVTSAAAPAPSTGKTQSAEVAKLAAREKQAQEQQDFKGGAAYIYVGSGALLVLVIVLLILLV
jgi:Tfp pilus assembly protein FimT